MTTCVPSPAKVAVAITLAAVLVATAATAATVATAQTTYPTVSLATYPADPAPGEPLTLKLSGIWTDGCTPESSAKVTIARSGSIFLVDLSYAGFTGGCTAALTPWSLSVSLDALDQGSYTVEVARSDDRGSRTIGAGSFAVAPPATAVFWVPGFRAVGSMGTLESRLNAMNTFSADEVDAADALITPLAAYDALGERAFPSPPITVPHGASASIDTRALRLGQAVQMLAFRAPARVTFRATLERLETVPDPLPKVPTSYGRVELPVFTDLFPPRMTTVAGDLTFTIPECAPVPEGRRRVNLTVFNAGASTASVHVGAASPAGPVSGFHLYYTVPARSLVQFNAIPVEPLPVCQPGGTWLRVTVDQPYLAYVSTVRPETFPGILPFEIFPARFER